MLFICILFSESSEESLQTVTQPSPSLSRSSSPVTSTVSTSDSVDKVESSKEVSYKYFLTINWYFPLEITVVIVFSSSDINNCKQNFS